jgi:hypothetical protein
VATVNPVFGSIVHPEEMPAQFDVSAVPKLNLPTVFFRFCDDGFRLRTRYLPTLVSPMSMPSLSNSPWMRSHFILFGEGSLRRALKNFCEHYHGERNHQGNANQLLLPRPARRSVRREAFDASRGWAGCSSTTTRTRPEVAKPLEPAGFWWSGLVCVVLAGLKLAAGLSGRGGVSLPLWAVLGHNILYIIVGFV